MNPTEQHNVIGKETVIEGTVRSKGNVHISGTIHGNVEVQGRTVVMAEGRVEGEVHSTAAEIGGHIQGQVLVAERLVLKATAVVEGDIRTGKLVIEDGATFTGRCDMTGGTARNARPGPSGVPRPEPSGVRPGPPGAEREVRTEERSGEGRPTRRLGGNPDAPPAAQA